MSDRSGTIYSPGPALQDMSVIADGGGHSWALHICAHPGNVRDTATPMRACLNIVDTAAADGDSVSLPAASGGQLNYVINHTPFAISVYAAPATTDLIYMADGSTFVEATLPASASSMFVSVPGRWIITSPPPVAPDTGDVPEAPTDGAAYVRSLAAWLNADTRYATPASLQAYLPKAGTTTNDAAPAGQIGEFLSSQRLQANAVPLASGTGLAVATLALTAGDWDVWGSDGFAIGSTATGNITLRAWINPAGGTQAPLLDQLGGNAVRNVTNSPGNLQSMMAVAAVRVSLAAAATVTLGASATFGGGTISAFGQIMARRRR